MDVCAGEWFTCLIPMQELRTEYGYTLGELPVFRTRASNERGAGEFSDLNVAGGRIQTEPTTMNPPQRDPSTTQDQIVITWEGLSEPLNGNSEVTSYNLQKLSGGNWVDLIGATPGVVVLDFTLTSEIERGVTYIFRLRAKNVHGWSAWSEHVSIKAAGIPYSMPMASSQFTTEGSVVI